MQLLAKTAPFDHLGILTSQMKIVSTVRIVLTQGVDMVMTMIM